MGATKTNSAGSRSRKPSNNFPGGDFDEENCLVVPGKSTNAFTPENTFVETLEASKFWANERISISEAGVAQIETYPLDAGQCFYMAVTIDHSLVAGILKIDGRKASNLNQINIDPYPGERWVWQIGKLLKLDKNHFFAVIRGTGGLFGIELLTIQNKDTKDYSVELIKSEWLGRYVGGQENCAVFEWYIPPTITDQTATGSVTDAIYITTRRMVLIAECQGSRAASSRDSCVIGGVILSETLGGSWERLPTTLVQGQLDTLCLISCNPSWVQLLTFNNTGITSWLLELKEGETQWTATKMGTNAVPAGYKPIAINGIRLNSSGYVLAYVYAYGKVVNGDPVNYCRAKVAHYSFSDNYPEYEVDISKHGNSIGGMDFGFPMSGNFKAVNVTENMQGHTRLFCVPPTLAHRFTSTLLEIDFTLNPFTNEWSAIIVDEEEQTICEGSIGFFFPISHGIAYTHTATLLRDNMWISTRSNQVFVRTNSRTKFVSGFNGQYHSYAKQLGTGAGQIDLTEKQHGILVESALNYSSGKIFFPDSM